MGADPVPQVARPGGLGVGVAAGAEHGHKDVGFPHLAGLRIGHGHRLAGMIDEGLLAGPVFLAQDDVQIARPLPYNSQNQL